MFNKKFSLTEKLQYTGEKINLSTHDFLMRLSRFRAQIRLEVMGSHLRVSLSYFRVLLNQATLGVEGYLGFFAYLLSLYPSLYFKSLKVLTCFCSLLVSSLSAITCCRSN